MVIIQWAYLLLQFCHLYCLQGGHYHYDTTPEEVEYLGYYNTAEVSTIITLRS